MAFYAIYYAVICGLFVAFVVVGDAIAGATGVVVAEVLYLIGISTAAWLVARR